MHSLVLLGGTFAKGARLEANAYSADSAERTKQNLYIATDSTPDNPTVFAKGVLLGHNAQLIPLSSGVANVLEGEVSVINNNGGQNPRIYPMEKNASLVFKDKFTGSGAKDQGVIVLSSSEPKKRNFSLSFLDDVTWNGAMYVRAQGNQIDPSCDYNVKIVLGSIDFHPYFRVDGNASGSGFLDKNLMRFAVASANDVAVLKNGLDRVANGVNFPFHHDTYLEFPVDAASGKAGKMVLESAFYGNTNEFIGVILTGNVFGGTATNRFELMSVPVARPLNAAAFRLLDEHGIDQGLTGEVVRFEVVNSEETSTLYAVVPPMVRYLASDSASQDLNKSPSVEIAECWSDGTLPGPGKDYIVCPTNNEHMIMRTPDTDMSGSWTFPGDSLAIARNASLRCFVGTLGVADLRMLDGSAFYAPYGVDVTGSISVSGTVRFGTYSAKYMYLTNAVLKGSGTIDFGGMWIAANANARYVLPADSPLFSGKMIVRTAFKDSNSAPSLESDYATLSISSAESLGADLPEPTADALTLSDYAWLSMSEPCVIRRSSNRGITIDGNGVFWTSSGGRDLRLETSLTVNGVLYKGGTSMLTLDCVTVAANGGGADRCVVQSGILNIADSRALKGLSLELQKGSKLSLEIDPDDADMAKKGIDLSDVENPISLASEHMGKIPFAEVSEASRIEAPFGTLDYGILTVKAGDADAVAAMLPARPPRYFKDANLSWARLPGDVEGTVTFAVRCERKALRVIVR